MAIIKSYYPYASKNYGINSIKMEFDNLTLFFSYDIVIAFIDSGELTIRKNDWSTTTGKHLNAINDNKKIRIDGNLFESKLARVLLKHKLSSPQVRV